MEKAKIAAGVKTVGDVTSKKDPKKAAKQAAEAERRLAEKQGKTGEAAPTKTPEQIAAEAQAKAKARAEETARKLEEKAKAKKEREEAAAKAKAEREAAKEAKANREPDWVTQLDEHGVPEQVDRNVFKYEIVCAHPGCTEHRWVTLSGLRETTMCKPHARKTRRSRRVERLKDRARNHKAIVEEAIELGLFPQEFLEKHGLI